MSVKTPLFFARVATSRARLAAVGVPAALSAHLPGKHDQSTHGRKGVRRVAKQITAEAANAMQDKMLDGNPWTEDHEEALNAYTGSDYGMMNDGLRGRTDLTKYYQDVIERIRVADDAMRPLPQPVKAFRHVDFNAFGIVHSDNGLTQSQLDALVGKTVQDPGFFSTSITPDIVGFTRDIHMEIDVPKGARAAYVQRVSVNKHEEELLLAPGTKFKVVSVEGTPGLDANGVDNPVVVKVKVLL